MFAVVTDVATDHVESRDGILQAVVTSGCVVLDMSWNQQSEIGMESNYLESKSCVVNYGE